MRHAQRQDLDYLTEAFIAIGLHMKKSASDPYIDNLPVAANATERELALQFIARQDAIALVEEADARPVACLLGNLAESSFPPSNLGKVGHIVVCWVEANYRRRGIAQKLVETAERWFHEHGATLVELSYMANNTDAQASWQRLGYQPYRVFAYKKISDR